MRQCGYHRKVFDHYKQFSNSPKNSLNSAKMGKYQDYGEVENGYYSTELDLPSQKANEITILPKEENEEGPKKQAKDFGEKLSNFDKNPKILAKRIMVFKREYRGNGPLIFTSEVVELEVFPKLPELGFNKAVILATLMAVTLFIIVYLNCTDEKKNKVKRQTVESQGDSVIEMGGFGGSGEKRRDDDDVFSSEDEDDKDFDFDDN